VQTVGSRLRIKDFSRKEMIITNEAPLLARMEASMARENQPVDIQHTTRSGERIPVLFSMAEIHVCRWLIDRGSSRTQTMVIS
jgi:hypothetical protein